MRASGILMGISSIPSKYGIGCFSKEAYDFVDQLEKHPIPYFDGILDIPIKMPLALILSPPNLVIFHKKRLYQI